jgi:hypothetical protein
MSSGRRPGRFQPLVEDTPDNGRPEQARWAREMKAAMNAQGISRRALWEQTRHATPPAGTEDQLEHWLANRSTVRAHAIPALAAAVGVHPLTMLAAYGLVEEPVGDLAARVQTAEAREHTLRDQLARRDQALGGALFAQAAAATGRWAVHVVPHLRGRSRARYHFADYVTLERIGALSDRSAAERDFKDVFERTAANWSNDPFPVDGVAQSRLGAVLVHRFAAPREPEPHAAILTMDPAGVVSRRSRNSGGEPTVRGIVVTGPHWSGSYAVAGLLSRALGWGLGSFARQARAVGGGAQLDFQLADDIMRAWLARPTSQPRRVWAHVLTDPPSPAGPSAQLFGAASEDAIVIMMIPDDERIEVSARLTGRPVAELRAEAEAWRRILPPSPRRRHILIPAPRTPSGAHADPATTTFADDYFDCSVEVALRVLVDLAGAEAPPAALVPPEMLAPRGPDGRPDPFAALAAAPANPAGGRAVPSPLAGRTTPRPLRRRRVP